MDLANQDCLEWKLYDQLDVLLIVDLRLKNDAILYFLNSVGLQSNPKKIRVYIAGRLNRRDHVRRMIGSKSILDTQLYVNMEKVFFNELTERIKSYQTSKNLAN